MAADTGRGEVLPESSRGTFLGLCGESLSLIDVLGGEHDWHFFEGG
jgi:hypothetical protein